MNLILKVNQNLTNFKADKTGEEQPKFSQKNLQTADTQT